MQQYSNTAVNADGLNFSLYFSKIATSITNSAELCCADCFHNIINNCYLYDYDQITQTCVQYTEKTSLSSYQLQLYSINYYVTKPNHASGIYYG